MKKILIISMPWPLVSLPSMQITILRDFLRQHNIEADAASLYADFADLIGFQSYEFLSREVFFVEAIFSASVHSEMRKTAISLIKKNADNRLDPYELFKNAELFLEAIFGEIRFNDYEFIGFSVVLNQLFSSLALVKRIKQANPKIKIIFGGNACSNEKGRSLMTVYPEIDYCISYEGEYPLLHLMQRKRQADIPGLIYRNNGKIIINPPQKKVVSLDDLPLPDFSEYFNRIHNTKNLKKHEAIFRKTYHSNRKYARMLVE